MIALSSQVSAQTPGGTQIDNSASAAYQYLNGNRDTVKSNTASMIVEAWGALSLNKTASRDNAMVGDTVQFKIVAQYVGNLSAAQVVVTDTVPSNFQVVGTTKGSINGNIVTWNAGTISAANPDSITITAVVKSFIFGTYHVTNRATAIDSAGTITQSSAQVVLNITQIGSCMIQIEASTKKLVANGLQWSVFKVFISDTLGVPKPNGTPVFFKADIGTFSNGKDSITRYTHNGYAVDSLNADLSTGNYVKSTVLVQLQSVCDIADTIEVEFYPGAITGVVLDQVSKKFYNGAFVRLIDSTTNLFIDADTTGQDGRFLMFVPKTGVYRVDVSASNSFALNATVTTYVPIDIKGTATNIIPNKNSISGTVYYWISNAPIYIPNMPIELFDITNGDNAPGTDKEAIQLNSVMKTTTDERGVYKFEDIKPGTYRVVLGASELNGLASITIPENGYYVLNGNIPVLLTASPTIEKSGPASAGIGDTVEYSIVVRNPNAFVVSNTVVTDSMQSDMEYIGSTPAGVYSPSSHTVKWNLGNIDSSYKNTIRVKVRINTLTAAQTLINHATLTAAEIYPINDTAVTKISRIANISIVKSVNKDSASIGDTLQYRIVIKNTGTSVLSNVIVADTINTDWFNTLLVSSNATLQNNIVTVSLDSLSLGDSVVVSVRVRVKESSVSGFRNTAFVRTSQTAIRSSSVVTPWHQTIAPNVANLVLTKSVSRDTVVNGDTIQYAIRFKNNGSKNLTNVVITDTLPKQVTRNTILYSNGTINNNIVTYFAGPLAVGAEDSVIIVSVVGGSPYTPERVTNTAHATANELTKQQSSVSFTSLIGKLDRIILKKTVSRASAFTGDSLKYVVNVTNVSNRTLKNLIVRDPIPFQLENFRVEDPNSPNPNKAISIVPISEAGMEFADSLKLQGSVVIFKKDSITVGEVDSFYVYATIKHDRPNFELILNTAYARTDATPQIIAQAVTLIQPRVVKVYDLELTKRVSKDTVHIGDTLSYVIHLKNIGNVIQTGISMVDTIPDQIINVSVIGNATVNGNVISYHRESLAPNQEDSIIVIGQLDPYNVHDDEYVLNYAFTHSDQVEEHTAYALFTAKTDPACRMTVTATPDKIIGNGRAKAYIEVRLTNTLGYPKPDGTPVVLTTTIGRFGNGQSMRVLYSKDGIVSDSLQATNAGNNMVNAMAIASADDGQGCKAKDTVFVLFYPGAIEGVVIDNRNRLPVNGAIVRAYSKSTDSLVGEAITKSDGYYLIPVAKTDSFRVEITTVNEFGRETTVRTNLTVIVTGNGDNPTPNQNSVSGAVYYLISREPVAAAGLTIYLQSVSPVQNITRMSKSMSVTTLDSTQTDSTGAYQFDRVSAGQFLVTLNTPTIKNSTPFSNAGNGQYVINANIAVTLNPNIVFKKSGPARVAMTDTAAYKITVQNIGTLSSTNTVVTDSLHPLMKFVSATGGGTYEPAAHRIIWNIGKFDSLASREYTVKVRFIDTLTNSTHVLNRASVNSNQTTIILDSVQTLLFLPPTMKMWKVSNVHQAEPGDTVVYSIKIKNLSGSLGDSVVVTDALPPQVEFIGSDVRYYLSTPSSVLMDTVTYNRTAHSIRWQRDTILVGDSATINLITRVRTNLEPGDYTYTNIASMGWRGGSLQSDQDSLSDATVRSFVTYLKITKQAIRKVVEIGDIATYVVRVTNMSSTSVARDIQVVDKIPFGFRYMQNSSFNDSTLIKDPTGTKELYWLLKDTLAPGASIQLMYRLVVGAGAAEGNGINTAQAYGISHYGTAMVSQLAVERVEIRRGVFSTHGLIIGKVFYDDNKNRYQDPNEAGVKGVELMMEDGTRIVTGDDGKYSIPDVLPGEHVIRVRTHTLPKNSSLLMGYNDFAKDSTSRFVNLTESGIARVDFYLARQASEPDSTDFHIAVAKVGNFSIQRIASPKNIVFIEDTRLASMKLTGLNFEVGKAILKPMAFVTLKQLADILRDYPEQPLYIAGHTDSMKIATEEFPNNKVLSMGRAMAVKNYLVEREGINVDRIRIAGYGESKPIASNKTIDGRALNRRVEFFFSPTLDEQQVNEMPISIEIPIEYTGSENITRIEFKDILDPAFTYVKGSARFGSAPIEPVMTGHQLGWTLTGVGGNVKKSLRYTVLVKRPDRYEATKVRSSSASVCYFVDDSLVQCIDSLTTTNEIAIAVKGRAVNFVMSGVLFDVAKASLRTSAMSSLETTAKFLKEDSRATAVIEGHTDSSPINTPEFPSNYELSDARAMTVKMALVNTYGIAPERIKTIGFGEYRPIASNETTEGRQSNRRIEIRIIQSEFMKSVLKEGGIDSSARAVQTMLPKNSPAQIDSMMKDQSKEMYIRRIEARRIERRHTVSSVIIDSLPAGFAMMRSTVTPMRGIDSVRVDGNVVSTYCSATDSAFSIFYITERTQDLLDGATVEHSVTLKKTQRDGKIVTEKSNRPVTEIGKKRTTKRPQQ